MKPAIKAIIQNIQEICFGFFTDLIKIPYCECSNENTKSVQIKAETK